MSAKNVSTTITHILIVLALVCCAPTAQAQDAGTHADSPALSRPYAHLHLFGSDFPAMQACPADDLVLLSNGPAGLQPVPLQIDRRNSAGRLLFPQETKYPQPGEPLTPYDELVFMAADAGLPLDDVELPPGSAKVRISDPAANQQAWFALACDKDRRIPRTGRDYIDYDSEKAVLLGTNFRVGSSTENLSVIDIIAIGAPDAPDVLDRLKMRAEAEVLGLFGVKRIETDIRGERVGYIDGPVRVVRKLAYSLRMFWNVSSPEVVRISSAYANQAEFPNDLRVPFNLDVIFSDIDIYTWFDLLPQAKGNHWVYTNRQTDQLAVDGRMTGPELNINAGVPWWICLHNGSEAVLMVVRPSEEMLKMPYTVTFRYQDDETKNDPPEQVPGQIGGFGFNIFDLNTFPKGEYSFGVTFYFTDRFQRGWENSVLVDTKAPLKICVLP